MNNLSMAGSGCYPKHSTFNTPPSTSKTRERRISQLEESLAPDE